MSGLSALAYLNDAPSHGLADIPLCACSQRILGVVPSLPDHTRQHTLLAALKRAASERLLTRALKAAAAYPNDPAACSFDSNALYNKKMEEWLRQ
jgi:hypothetical protein